jgi:outer membrane murein-binding lipoprotein Lpp
VSTRYEKPDEVAAAIRELAEQVDQLGNAVASAAATIAKAIRPPAGSGGSQVTDRGTFS